MQKYADLNNDSGVTSFLISDSSIKVWFNQDSYSYVYSYESAGKYHVEHMKKLAIHGAGLNTYINRYVKDDYLKND